MKRLTKEKVNGVIEWLNISERLKNMPISLQHNSLVGTAVNANAINIVNTDIEATITALRPLLKYRKSYYILAKDSENLYNEDFESLIKLVENDIMAVLNIKK